MIKKIKGIVIRTKALQEADRLVTILSKKEGIKSFIFKGVVKSKSRKLNTSDIGSVIAFTYRQKNSDAPAYAQEVKLINPFKNIKYDYNKFLYINYICELFFNLTYVDDIKILYNFLYNILIFLEDNNIGEIILRYVEFRLIKLNGIMPDFEFCSICNKQLNNSIIFYDFSSGHTVCETCANLNCRKLDDRLVNTLNILDKSSLVDLPYLDIKNINIGLRNFFHQIIVSYLNKELKSYKIVNSLI